MSKETKWTIPEKPKLHLIPYESLIVIAHTIDFGIQKHGSRDWELNGLPYSEKYDAGWRHRAKWWAGEDLDPESGLHHLAHSATNEIMNLTMILRDIGKDDRMIFKKR